MIVVPLIVGGGANESRQLRHRCCGKLYDSRQAIGHLVAVHGEPGATAQRRVTQMRAQALEAIDRMAEGRRTSKGAGRRTD